MWGLLASIAVGAWLRFHPPGGVKMPWVQRFVLSLVAGLMVGAIFDYHPHRGSPGHPVCPEIGVCAPAQPAEPTSPLDNGTGGLG